MLGAGDLIVKNPAIGHGNALMRADSSATEYFRSRADKKNIFSLSFGTKDLALDEVFLFNERLPHFCYICTSIELRKYGIVSGSIIPEANLLLIFDCIPEVFHPSLFSYEKIL